jgi:hypothetical protein
MRDVATGCPDLFRELSEKLFYILKTVVAVAELAGSFSKRDVQRGNGLEAALSPGYEPNLVATSLGCGSGSSSATATVVYST